jgi:putative transposase
VERPLPGDVRLWRTHWEQFTPFLAFPPEVRRVIYTTNLIESINSRLRKVTRNRGQFPSEQAVLKVLYLASATSRSSAGPPSGSEAPAGSKPCKRSRSTSRGGFPPP